jgi:hypothetical protein
VRGVVIAAQTAVSTKSDRPPAARKKEIAIGGRVQKHQIVVDSDRVDVGPQVEALGQGRATAPAKGRRRSGLLGDEQVAAVFGDAFLEPVGLGLGAAEADETQAAELHGHSWLQFVFTASVR